MRFDFFTQILRCAADHQARYKHRQDGKNKHAVKTRSGAAKHHLTELHHHHRHHAAQRREGVVHGIDRTTGRGGGDDGEQARRVDAEARLLAFHVAARLQKAGALVNPERRQQRVTRLLGRHDGQHGNHKHHGHGGQYGPALALVADSAPESKAQRGRDEKDRDHLEKINQRVRVFVRMRRVRIEKAPAVGAQHLDGLLRSHRPHGQRLRAGLHVLQNGVALGVFQRLAVRAIFRLLIAGNFQRADVFVGIKVLDHALLRQENCKNQRQRQQQPDRDARQVYPKVSNHTCGARSEAAKQGKHHSNTGCSRKEVLHCQRQRLREVAHGRLAGVALPVGIGDKTHRSVECRVRRYGWHARGIQRQPDLQALQRIDHQQAQHIEGQQCQRVM